MAVVPLVHPRSTFRAFGAIHGGVATVAFLQIDATAVLDGVAAIAPNIWLVQSASILLLLN